MDLVLPSAERGARSFPIGGKTWIAGLAVVFVTCILPFFILAFLPVWNVYRRRRRLRDEAQRRALASKVAKTIRESYILRLTEDYSTILSKSDILDEYESEEEEEEDTGTTASEEGGSTTDTTSSSSSSSGTCSNTCADNSATIKTITIPSSSSDVFTESNGDTTSTTSTSTTDTSRPIQDGDGDGNDDIDIEMQQQNDNDDNSTNEHQQDDNKKDTISGSSRTANCNDADNDNQNRAHYQTIYVPPPGQTTTIETTTAADNDNDNDDHQHHGTTTKTTSVTVTSTASSRSGGCAVCLNAFCANQKVTWSSNPDCPHVFHHQCLMDWYTAVGTKAYNHGNNHNNNSNQTQTSQTTIQRISHFPTLCPCCRREFFLDKEEAKQACQATKQL